MNDLYKIFSDEKTRKACHILQMLEKQADAPHLSFHTPGHKVAGWDITELVYSDNLSCPKGCIARAEKDIAEILGGAKSFILTDGSTSGVLAMLYAAKLLGAKTVAVCEDAHKSVYNGCKILGLIPLVYARFSNGKIPYAPDFYTLLGRNKALLQDAEVLFFTSPDYYGNCADLAAARRYCDDNKKLLIVDGAHGGHLKGSNLHPSLYADMWVDGVHKSLPALTQGAVVSAARGFENALAEGVDVFRTTSPSYPIMASVEYAIKYPENKELQSIVHSYKKTSGRVYPNADWTKLCVLFGEFAFDAEKYLQEKGIYPEFCDGNTVTFYLSPATKTQDFIKLTETLETLYKEFPFLGNESGENCVQRIPAPTVFKNEEKENAAIFSGFAEKKVEWLPLSAAENRVCARLCGLFPPCTPLLSAGERITKEKIELLQKANHVFGLKDGQICVFANE